ncbi:MAG: DUF4173 domain-containing protein [Bacteroidota bacterium]
MERRSKILIVSISTLLFTLLFHNQALGLNILIFELSLMVWLFFSKQYKFSGKNQISCIIGLLITMFSTVFVYSVFAFFVNFLMLFLWVGMMIYPEVHSLVNAFRLSFSNLLHSQVNFIHELTNTQIKNHKIARLVWKLKIFIIPLLIVVFFLFLYSHSNPVFNRLLENTALFFNRYLTYIFGSIDTSILFTLLIGLLLSIFILLRTKNLFIVSEDKASNNHLYRTKKSIVRNFKINALRDELKAAVFLLFILNAILVVLNAIDIYWVWFNFEWNGLTLKQFVHEGTYLLIFSIITSIIVVLYFFRNNLNFYASNRLLKYLSYIWLAQNAVLAISVAIRNYWYIYYFSLAYKRIGVIIFLVLTLYGLYTVLIKVKKQKSDFWLLNANTYALVVILVFCSVFNWDSLIAKYNFKHSNRSFVHFDYLASLSDKAIPYLDKALPELIKIDSLQKERFPAEQTYYMSSDQYFQTLTEKKKIFKLKWESKNFLSWNLPEYLAYKNLYPSGK